MTEIARQRRCMLIGAYSPHRSAERLQASAGGGFVTLIVPPLDVELSNSSGVIIHAKNHGGSNMRAVIFGLAAATVLFAAVPASTQELRLRAPGVDVDVGNGPRGYRDREYRRSPERSYGYDRRFREGGCRTITVQRDDGSVRRTRRCG
jgi:hypothetical protein